MGQKKAPAARADDGMWDGTTGEVVVAVSYSHYQAECGVGDAADSKRRTGGVEKKRVVNPDKNRRPSLGSRSVWSSLFGEQTKPNKNPILPFGFACGRMGERGSRGFQMGCELGHCWQSKSKNAHIPMFCGATFRFWRSTGERMFCVCVEERGRER